MVTISNPENMTLLELCSVLNTAMDYAIDSDVNSQSTAPPNYPVEEENKKNVSVLVAPYLLIATTIITVLIVDFIRYRRTNTYKYRRKQEKREHNRHHYRKVRGSARVPMDPEHLTFCKESDFSSTANENSNPSAHDQGHEFADDDIGGLSAAVTAENSKANMAKFAASSNDAENGMAAWQLKFGKNDPNHARFMTVSGVKKK